MTTTHMDTLDAAPTGVDATFANVLAEILRVERVPVDSHFFEDLGADSLVMAHFCARVRKRGDLPSVSMKDIYRHPTIRTLAAALAMAAPAPAVESVQAPADVAEAAGQPRDLLGGALHLVLFLGYTYLVALGAAAGYEWISAAPDGVGLYVRLVLWSITALVVVSVFPILVKWTLIGRWKAGRIPIWSPAYVRF